jgi:nucleoid-associated protein YgaU
MYNTDMPTRAELPTSARLIRSTAIAFVTAVVLLVTVVMPADYGIDPTGIGRVLNLTEMGEIKKDLAAEAAADDAALAAGGAAAAAAPAVQSTTTAAPVVSAAPAPVAAVAAVVWRDETPVTLEPGAGIEIKLTMKEGDKALFDWAVQGGVVNFDTHGESFPRSISYEKGRGVASKQGELVAAFSGKHGWFFRNRGDAPVTVLLKTAGTYSEIDR